MNHTILVADDEPQIRRFLQAGFEMSGFTVLQAETGRKCLEMASLRRPDLVVLDLGLPDLDGMEVLRDLRGWSQVPVIVLSVRDREDDKVGALSSGADDYVTKPFGMAELIARVKVALKHSVAPTGNPVVEIGNLRIDLLNRRISESGQDISLTPKEYRLLAFLARHPGRVVTHRQILSEVWGAGHGEDLHYLRIFIRKLRAKIEPEPNTPIYLQTELGVGYRLQSGDRLPPPAA
ncbi:response regulator [Lacibacterium aquatile]|uniref:Response regulator n=1 Tax=Lacibacterium aquatile TaxID=1168082 RepID=A0ABW5DP12_9PROT